MPVPYTRDAIEQLRAAARTGLPHDAVVAKLGWSPGMIERVCRDHGIVIAPRIQHHFQTHVDVLPPPLPTEQLAQFGSTLPPRQATILTALRAASLVSDEFIPASALSGAEARSARTRAIGRVVAILVAKMSEWRLPYHIQRKANEGYRLKFTGAP